MADFIVHHKTERGGGPDSALVLSPQALSILGDLACEKEASRIDAAATSASFVTSSSSSSSSFSTSSSSSSSSSAVGASSLSTQQLQTPSPCEKAAAVPGLGAVGGRVDRYMVEGRWQSLLFCSSNG